MTDFPTFAKVLAGIGGASPLAATVCAEIERISGRKPSVDALGSLSVCIGDGAKRVCVMCPLDAPSLAVTFIESDGGIPVHPLGACDANDRVVSTRARRGVAHDGMAVFGFSSREEAEKEIAIGDTLYFAEEAKSDGDAVCAVSGGMKAGVYAALLLMERLMAGIPDGLTAVFSFVSQSALSFRGEAPAAVNADAAELIYLAADEREDFGLLAADKSGAYDEGLLLRLECAAKAAGIPAERVADGDKTFGASAAAGGGRTVKTAALLVPFGTACKPLETVKTGIPENAAEVVYRFLTA